MWCSVSSRRRGVLAARRAVSRWDPALSTAESSSSTPPPYTIYPTPAVQVAALQHISILPHVLFCSLAVLDPRVGHTMNVLHLSLSCVILTDSSTGSPVHVLMLSIQAVRGLPRLHAHAIFPCIISFSRQLPCFLMVWPQYMLATLLWRCLTVSCLLQLC